MQSRDWFQYDGEHDQRRKKTNCETWQVTSAEAGLLIGPRHERRDATSPGILTLRRGRCGDSRGNRGADEFRQSGGQRSPPTRVGHPDRTIRSDLLAFDQPATRVYQDGHIEQDIAQEREEETLERIASAPMGILVHEHRLELLGAEHVDQALGEVGPGPEDAPRKREQIAARHDPDLRRGRVQVKCINPRLARGQSEQSTLTSPAPHRTVRSPADACRRQDRHREEGDERHPMHPTFDQQRCACRRDQRRVRQRRRMTGQARVQSHGREQDDYENSARRHHPEGSGRTRHGIASRWNPSSHIRLTCDSLSGLRRSVVNVTLTHILRHVVLESPAHSAVGGVTVIIEPDSAPLQIRPYEPGDERAIRDLFRSVFDREMSLSHWTWRYAHGPAGAATIVLAWDGPSLVGHYALVPVLLQAQGRRIRSGHAVDIMTHPDYRSMGVFPRLGRTAHELARKDGIEFVWGFPNRDSHRGFIEVLGWWDLAQISPFSARCADIESQPIRDSVRIAECVDARYDELWARVARPDRVSVHRSADYVRWRFIDNPRDSYQVLERVDGGQLLGYAAIKPDQNQLQIVDLVFGEPEVGLDLCSSVAQLAGSRGVESMGLWLDPASPLYRHLEAWGFRSHGPVTYLAGRDLRSSSAWAPLASRAWKPAMSDSDVY